MFAVNAFQANAFQHGIIPGIAPTPQDETRGKGGWDPYYYKKRNKRRTKKEDVQAFLSEILGREIENAPEPVQAQAEAAKIAATQYLAVADTALQDQALLSRALEEINGFYAELRQELQRRRAIESDEEDEILLLMS